MALADIAEGVKIQCHCGNEFIHVRIPQRAGRNPSLCAGCRRAGRSKPRVERETPYIVPDIDSFPAGPELDPLSKMLYEGQIKMLSDERDLLAGKCRNEHHEAERLRRELVASEARMEKLRVKINRPRSEAMKEIYEACRPRHPSTIAVTIERRVRVRASMDDQPQPMSEHIRAVARSKGSFATIRIDALLELAADCVQEIARIQRSTNSL